MKTSIILLPAVAVFLLGGVAAPARSAEPRLFLAWHAPHGAPGASDTLSVRRGDGGRDTLFLSFETAANWPQFCGLVGTVYFRAPVDDSLAAHWLDEKNIEVEFVTDSIPGYPRMWRGTQSMRFSYWELALGSASLRLSNVRPPSLPEKLRDGVPYVFARVMIDHPPADAIRGDQPICVEWARAEFLPDSTGATTVMATSRGRGAFVSLNSRGGKVCEAFLPAELLKPAAAPKKPARGKRKATSGK